MIPGFCRGITVVTSVLKEVESFRCIQEPQSDEINLKPKVSQLFFCKVSAQKRLLLWNELQSDEINLKPKVSQLFFVNSFCAENFVLLWKEYFCNKVKEK